MTIFGQKRQKVYTTSSMDLVFDKSRKEKGPSSCCWTKEIIEDFAYNVLALTRKITIDLLLIDVDNLKKVL